MMRLLSIQGLQTKSKPALLRYIIKHLRRKSKRHLVMIAYNISKSKLPRLSLSDRQSLKRIKDWDKPKRKALPKPKKKKEKLTKAEKKRRQKKLSALNKWRVSQGMKKIVIK